VARSARFVAGDSKNGANDNPGADAGSGAIDRSRSRLGHRSVSGKESFTLPGNADSCGHACTKVTHVRVGHPERSAMERGPDWAAGDAGRHGRAAHPQAAQGKLFSGLPGAAPDGREGAHRGGAGRRTTASVATVPGRRRQPHRLHQDGLSARRKVTRGRRAHDLGAGRTVAVPHGDLSSAGEIHRSHRNVGESNFPCRPSLRTRAAPHEDWRLALANATQGRPRTQQSGSFWGRIIVGTG
jgi:hypothetical protein